uniref:AlNc14C6G821 protein n=1 Tax=Albugo laibachii Nc14 TaxID=890382 RepID=F0W142_9STRA|nr:AlNc14C6G821 [Albugo laibachii Nc14]|eukprot:CCA14766.1 AlNc14C6G821 [Albugo laibachii Nc14]
MRDQLLCSIAILASFSCVIWYTTKAFGTSTRAFHELCKVDEIVADIASRLKALERDVENSVQKSQSFSARIIGIEQEFEKVLEFLDSIHGDNNIRRRRKAIADRITLTYLESVDELKNKMEK